jgi:hypothetical protein
MIDEPDLLLAHECIRRATADVEMWLSLVEQGQLATVSPFGQMFVYQLKKREKLDDNSPSTNCTNSIIRKQMAKASLQF